MPWKSDREWSLTEEQGELTPARNAVFGFLRAGRWIFIGHTRNLRQTLLGFLNGSKPWVAERQPSHFVYETCAGHGCSERCSELTREYQPEYLDCAKGD